MNHLDIEQYTNETLLLVVSHEELFDAGLVAQAKIVWEQRNLSKEEIEALVKVQVETLGVSQNLANSKKSTAQVVPLLLQNGIDESIATIYSKSLKPKNYLLVVIFIFVLVVIIRLLMK